MIFFMKLGGNRAMTIEFNKEFGIWPVYKKTSYHCETILDMPYTQIIFTSGKWTPLRRAAKIKAVNDDKSKSETSKAYKNIGGADES